MLRYNVTDFLGIFIVFVFRVKPKAFFARVNNHWQDVKSRTKQ
jgi:hypothetical protein